MYNVALLNNVKKRTRFRFHSPGAEVERPWERFWERLLKEEGGIYFVIMLTKSTANIQSTEVLLFLAEDEAASVERFLIQLCQFQNTFCY